MNQATVLRVNDLSFSYNKQLVFKDVSFELSAGQIAALVGRNGSGKTTLMRCLAAWVSSKSGTITLCDKPFDGSTQNQRSQIFFVNDSPAFYDDLTAEEHIHFILSVNKKRELLPVADTFLKKFALEEYKAKLPSSYSRGMRLKLALCIALTLRPPLILLDEPFGPLDHESAALLCTELKTASEKGSAILLSLHQHVIGLEPHVNWKLKDNTLFLSEYELNQNNQFPSDETA